VVLLVKLVIAEVSAENAERRVATADTCAVILVCVAA